MTPDIVIVGDGVAGWMAAAGLANALKGRGRIRLVALGDEAPAAVAEATLPAIRAFHDGLGIDEDDLIGRTAATFRLGAAFDGWACAGAGWFLPFGQIGTSIGTIGFHHAWLRLRSLGQAPPLEAYSLAAAAASLGRFQRPSQDLRSVLSSYAYGLHLDGGAYREHMRAYALARGVEPLRAPLAAVLLRGEDGFIQTLQLEGGERIEADLYVDGSDHGRLIGQALGVGWQDWSDWLPCDRMLATRAAAGDPAPCTRVQGRPSGWRWRMPLPGSSANGFVWSSQLLDDEAAAAELWGSPDAAPAIERFSNGRRLQFWSRNCVAIGPAAEVLEPLAAGRLDLIQSAVSRLIRLLPAGACDPAEAAEYNRLSIAEHDRIRDFLILHYHLSGRQDGPLWRPRRDLPDGLAHKIEMFAARARVVAYDGETFQTPSWLAAFIGMGLTPRRYHPFADSLEPEDLRRRLHTLAEVVRQAAHAMPAHAAFLNQCLGTARASLVG